MIRRANPKNDDPLDPSLESFRANTMAWLSELDFWSDEMFFFYNLLHRRRTKISFHPRELAEAETELVKLYQKAVINHELLLSSVTKSDTLPEERLSLDARQKLLGDVQNLHHDIRVFKRRVFSLIQKYEQQ